MEIIGRECFDELVTRSFFQHSSNDISRYTMHDLLVDLATTVALEFFLTLGEKMDVEDRNEALEKLRHLSFIRQPYGVYRKFKALQRARRLRTFLAVSVRLDDNFPSHLSNKIVFELLPQLRFLRVLSLTNYLIKEVPQSIGNLIHLRYLNFSKTGIINLPDKVGNLYNLQSLLVSGCAWLSSLPDSLTKLINLRHLDISNTPQLNNIPFGISRLTGLQTLSKIIIGGANGFKISDLKGLVHLQGQLSIKGMHKVMNSVHAKEANLEQKKGLRDLEMEWSDVFDDSRDVIIEHEVLEGLKPCNKLKSLTILYYAGTKYSSWVGDPSFVSLTHLTLRGCRNSVKLPTLGHLGSLQKLFVEGMNGLKRLDSEFLRTTNLCNGIAFPSLEVLEFKDMEGWEIWSTNGGDTDETASSFPCLREISIANCPKLDVVEIDLIPSLHVLHIQNCSIVVLRGMVSVSSSILRLTMDKIQGLSQLQGEMLEHLGDVEFLSFRNCNDLRYLWESELVACRIFVNLRTLKVNFCDKLVSLGEKEVNLEVSSLEYVKEVNLSYCPRLENFRCPNGIEKLEISSCSSLTFPTLPMPHDLPSTLKVLGISRCNTLEVCWLFENFLSSLESLSISGMQNFKLLPEGCLVHLSKLTICNCDNIEFIPEKGFGFFPLLCLTYLSIEKCKNLKTFPHEHLQSLTSLEELSIRDCPNMDYSFPCGLWPPNLSTLKIGGLKKPISEWEQQSFPTSLVELWLYGRNSGVVSFAKSEDVIRDNINTTSSSFVLPPSLTFLNIDGFVELESVSEGLQHLTCLKCLLIFSCPKLRDLPEKLLPLLSCLWVFYCPKLGRRCSRKGNYWPIISQIPYLVIRRHAA